MFADLTPWITRDLMFHCTLWTDPQVSTGWSFRWSLDKGQGTGIAGDLLDGSEQTLPPGEKDCSSFLPHLPSHTRAACFFPCLTCSVPTSQMILLLSSQLSQSRKLACRSLIHRLWPVRVAVWWYSQSLGCSGSCSLAETCTVVLNASLGVAWCGCQQVNGSWALNPLLMYKIRPEEEG